MRVLAINRTFSQRGTSTTIKRGRWRFDIESVLIVSRVERITAYVEETMSSFSVRKVSTVSSCSEARRMLGERDFDLVVINAPLQDETGERLSRDIASANRCQVILLVKSEYYDEISAAVEDYGVITVSRPISKSLFYFSVKLAKAAQSRLTKVQTENMKLTQKLEDIRMVGRAKALLTRHLSMSEEDAHKYIERQAMDNRETKREVAESILKLYENR